MLAFEPKEPGIMNRPPLDPGQPLLNRVLSGTYLPVMNIAFSTQPLGLRQWSLIISASFFIYVVIEFEKWIRRRKSI
jgi:hypothetical protein